MAHSISGANFDSVISGADTPVLVDFWAPWCGPCRALGPIIDQVAEEKAGVLSVYKCNVDENAELAGRFGIMSIPTLIIFKGGAAVHTMVGSMPKQILEAELAPYL